jgi:lipopolysaccharide exporter
MITNQNNAAAPARTQSLRDSMLRGAAWMLAMRMSLRLVGLVSTVVVARLLMPDDYGLIAMAMIVVAFVDAFNDMGLDLALIRTRKLEAYSYNTAWTLSAIVGGLNAAVLVASAPHVATFYDDRRLEGLLYVMAVLPLVNGLANPRVADFRRELHFQKDFAHQLISRLIALPVTILAALLLRSYWALVAGMLVGSITSVSVGYYMRPFLPRPCLSGYRSLLSFSVWVQIRSIGAVLSSRFDQLFIGKTLSAGDVGGYRLSQEIADMATVETTLPLGRALLPGYALLQDSGERQREAFLKVLGAYAMLAFAFGGSLFSVSDDFIIVLLGEQWQQYAGVFRLLVIAAVFTAMGGVASPLLVAAGRIRVLALYTWVQLALMIAGLSIVATVSVDLAGVAAVRIIVSAFMFALLISATVGVSGASIKQIRDVLVRPLLALVGMMIAIELVDVPSDVGQFVGLAYKLLVGVVSYAAIIESTWLFVGRPDGIENEMNLRLFRLVVGSGGR